MQFLKEYHTDGTEEWIHREEFFKCYILNVESMRTLNYKKVLAYFIYFIFLKRYL